MNELHKVTVESKCTNFTYVLVRVLPRSAFFFFKSKYKYKYPLRNENAVELKKISMEPNIVCNNLYE